MLQNTQLRAVNHVGDSLLSDNLEANVLSFFSWGLLGAGGFSNITRNASGVYGGDQSQLRMVDDPYHPSETVFEAFRKDWVWETGVPCPDGQPIRVSGVYVDGHFWPLSSGVVVDYPNGRVTLPYPVPYPSSVVQCEYSYRLFQMYTADADWWQTLQLNSFRVDDSQFLQQGSGAWDVLSENRVQLPALIVEAAMNTDRKPYEIGSYSAFVRQEVRVHILSEDRWYYKWAHDAIGNQFDRVLPMFDKNILFASGLFPLNAYGSPVPSGLMYPDFIGLYATESMRFVGMRSQEHPRIGNIRACTVRLSVEAIV